MIVVLMGVSGAGKTTVGKLLSEPLGWPLLDADDYHPPANIEKMRSDIGAAPEAIADAVEAALNGARMSISGSRQ